ncbi:MAG TPA: F0F1 ATP synthase subunit A [Myxococcota bacterium]|nr:F0F1 ATP synthase subunit A [Myxococcota bacterium]
MIFHELEHYLHVSWVIQAALIAGALLLFGGVLIRRRVATADGGVMPDEGITVRNLLEVLVEWLAGMARERMGPDWRKYFPVVGTMFFFILISNLMGLVPGLAGATSDVNTTAAWAIMSWVFYTAIGIAKHKHQYLVKFMGPSFFEKEIFGRHVHFRLLIPIFLPLEIVLDLARILTLAVRLLANMFADHTVVAVWLSLMPVVVPAVFMGLGLVVAFLQAFVFALLTMIYIGLALEDPH